MPQSVDVANEDAAQPLSGLRVLDLSQVMAGPFCCMLLGDMGADVIKVEPPTGDQTRHSMGYRMKGEDTAGFLALNRNKRSVVLDLKTAAGRAIFYDLVATADILVENARPGVMTRLEADYASLSAKNPRLIYASISGFGQTGPWSERPGYDLIAQAMSGIMSITGEPGGAPVKCGIPVTDLGAGLFAAFSIVNAVLARQRTGRGQHIDTSLYDAGVALSVWESTEYWASGTPPKPTGSAHRMSAPYQAFEASDGAFVIGAGNPKLWALLCKAIGREDLMDREAFKDGESRLRNVKLVEAALQPIFREKSVTHWVDTLLAAGVPAGPINDYEAALGNPHAEARGAVITFDHPVEGTVRALGFPAKMSATPATVRRVPPLLGEHTRALLAELGVDENAERLADAGAFGPTAPWRKEGAQ